MGDFQPIVFLKLVGAIVVLILSVLLIVNALS